MTPLFIGFRETDLNISPNATLAAQIARVRQLSRASLTQYSTRDTAAAYETILIKDGNLWGFKFSSGNFHARWQINGDEIQLLCESQLLERLRLDGQPLERPAARRAA